MKLWSLTRLSWFYLLMRKFSYHIIPGCNLWGSLSTGPEQPKLHVEDHHRWQELCLQLQPRDRQRSQQRSDPQFPGPKKLYQIRGATRSMLGVFFDICEVVHHEIVPQGHSVNTECYSDILKHLRENVWHNDRWHLGSPTGQSVHSHSSFLPSTQFWLPTHKTFRILASWDSFLFPKLKFGLWVVAVDPSIRSMVTLQMFTPEVTETCGNQVLITIRWC